jgi:hypothetical protein
VSRAAPAAARPPPEILKRQRQLQQVRSAAAALAAASKKSASPAAQPAARPAPAASLPVRASVLEALPAVSVAPAAAPVLAEARHESSIAEAAPILIRNPSPQRSATIPAWLARMYIFLAVVIGALSIGVIVVKSNPRVDWQNALNWLSQ